MPPQAHQKFRPPTAEEAERDNDRRLRAVRKQFGYVPFRLLPQIPIHSSDTIAWRGKAATKPKKTENSWRGWGLIRGRSIPLRVDEAVDVFDLLRDLRIFIQHWRPERARTPAGAEAARTWLDRWKQLT